MTQTVKFMKLTCITNAPSTIELTRTQTHLVTKFIWAWVKNGLADPMGSTQR